MKKEKRQSASVFPFPFTFFLRVSARRGLRPWFLITAWPQGTSFLHRELETHGPERETRRRVAARADNYIPYRPKPIRGCRSYRTPAGVESASGGGSTTCRSGCVNQVP